MKFFHTATEVRSGDFVGTQYATVKADTEQEAAAKVEQVIRESGWEMRHTDVRPAR